MVKFVLSLRRDGLEGKTDGKETRQESLGWSGPERRSRY